MPTLAGWITGEQVSQEIIEQTLTAMGNVLGQHGGELARTVQPGAGLIAFSDTAYVVKQNDDPPLLDWVPDRRTLVYRRPLSGIHQLYYIQDWPSRGNLLFASEIKALFAVGVPRLLHVAALDTLLRYGFIPAPWTAFKDIHVVPAGSILRWQRAKTVLNQFTDFSFDEPLPQTDLQEHLHALLDETSSHLQPLHDAVVALTDGKNASALSTALWGHHAHSRFPVVTLGYTKNLSSPSWQMAEGVAQACQCPFLAITGVDQPDFWVATLAGLEAPCVDTRALALHQLLHTTSAETQARVAVSGLGAQMLLGTATQTLLRSAAAQQESKDVLTQYRQALSHGSSRPSLPIARLWSHDASKQLEAAEPWEETLHARKLARRATQWEDTQQAWYYLDLHLRLPDVTVSWMHLLATQERMVVRSPYLSTRVIDLLVRLPSTLEDATPKAALLSTLAQRYIPQRAEGRSRFSLLAPTASLLRIGDSELLQQVLSEDALRSTGIFDVETVKTLIEQSGTKEATRELLLVFTTQLLCHLFSATL